MVQGNTLFFSGLSQSCVSNGAIHSTGVIAKSIEQINCDYNLITEAHVIDSIQYFLKVAGPYTYVPLGFRTLFFNSVSLIFSPTADVQARHSNANAASMRDLTD